ncbi:MAG: hypothetical protein CL912_01030 [Deltaproteobacteria bacterium]|nr:hypothetical protein [Deltaproteobacteria bacterium]
MVVEFGGVLIHDMLGILHSIGALDTWRRRINLLFFWMRINEEVFDGPIPGRSLINGKARGELVMGANLNGIEETNCEILAIVADDVVCSSLLPHLVDGHHS